MSVNASTSTDDGSITSYTWSWGDNTADTTGPTATASHTYGSAGQYPVKLTVTDNDGATGTTTSQVTVTAPAFLARDDFGRTVANGWGTADTGGRLDHRWAGGPLVGGVRSRSAQPERRQRVHRVPALRVDPYADVTLSVGRRQGLHGWWPVRQRHRPPGQRHDRLPRQGADRVRPVRSTCGWLGRWWHRDAVPGGGVVSGLTYAVGDRLEVRLQVTGTSPTTVRAKVWKSGGTEPTAWTRTSSDSPRASRSPVVSGSTTTCRARPPTPGRVLHRRVPRRHSVTQVRRPVGGARARPTGRRTSTPGRSTDPGARPLAGPRVGPRD